MAYEAMSALYTYVSFTAGPSACGTDQAWGAAGGGVGGADGAGVGGGALGAGIGVAQRTREPLESS